ncbi:TOBE domain-containing protein [Roseiarcus sp.]|uniref:TOBE domain-containing protein n=1 Tax=Roseiarcus sp. TaxID=1969460 RepID=UPI003F96C404
MKLSARNVLPGKVVPITKGATSEHVRIEVGAEMVTAPIANDAVDALALEVGKLAPAVIQASDVMIVIDV